MKLVKNTDSKNLVQKQISDKDAEEAFRTILTWMGEDPSREGLIETPKRVIKAFKEYKSDVINSKFPAKNNIINIDKTELDKFKNFVKKA